VLPAPAALVALQRELLFTLLWTVGASLLPPPLLLQLQLADCWILGQSLLLLS
jgi:hypothetical protein